MDMDPKGNKDKEKDNYCSPAPHSFPSSTFRSTPTVSKDSRTFPSQSKAEFRPVFPPGLFLNVEGKKSMAKTKTDRQKDTKTERQKYKKTERQKDRKTESEADVNEGQFF